MQNGTSPSVAQETLAECIHQGATLRRLDADWSGYALEIRKRMLDQRLTRATTRQGWTAELDDRGTLELFNLRLVGAVPTHRK